MVADRTPMVIVRWSGLSCSIGEVTGGKKSDVSTDHPFRPSSSIHRLSIVWCLSVDRLVSLASGVLVISISADNRLMPVSTFVNNWLMSDRYASMFDRCLHMYIIDFGRTTWDATRESRPSHDDFDLGNGSKLAQNTLQIHRLPYWRTTWLGYMIIWPLRISVEKNRLY